MLDIGHGVCNLHWLELATLEKQTAGWTSTKWKLVELVETSYNLLEIIWNQPESTTLVRIHEPDKCINYWPRPVGPAGINPVEFNQIWNLLKTSQNAQSLVIICVYWTNVSITGQGQLDQLESIQLILTNSIGVQPIRG